MQKPEKSLTLSRTRQERFQRKLVLDSEDRYRAFWLSLPPRDRDLLPEPRPEVA